MLALSPSGSAVHVFGSSDEPHAGTVCTVKEANPAVEELGVHKGEIEDKALCGPNKIHQANTDGTSGNTADQENKNEITMEPLQTIESKIGMPGKLVEKAMIEYNTGMENIASSCQTLRVEVTLSSDIHTVKQCEVLDIPMANFPGKRCEGMTSLVKEEGKGRLNVIGFTSEHPLEKLKGSAENNCQHLVSKGGCGQIEERPQDDEPVPLLASPTSSRAVLYQRKGKGKALSDGQAGERMSKDEDDSHESVESCNSAGLISKGMKRLSFEEQLNRRSKRIKMQIQECPSSSNPEREDSSFVNWISSMVKGLVKYSHDEARSLSPTLANKSHGIESPDAEIIICDEHQDSQSRNMGFQSIFQSLYSKAQGPKMLNEGPSLGGFKEGLTDKTYGAGIISASCHDDEPCKKSFGVGEKFSEPAFGRDEGPSTRYLSPCTNIAATRMTYKTDSEKNRTTSLPKCHVGRDGGCSSGFPLAKDKAICAKKDHDDSASEGKSACNVSSSDCVRSSWLHNQNTCAELDLSDCCARLPSTQNCLNYPMDEKSSRVVECPVKDLANVLAEELHYNSPISKYPSGFKRNSKHVYQNTMHQKNSFQHSPNLSSSEGMASIFARRLDALKHINPSNIKYDATPISENSFFGGLRAHNSNTELEGPLNASSHDGEKSYPFFCIKCFQLDHWENACPEASSSRLQHAARGASLFNQRSSNKLQLYAGTERDSTVWKTKETCRIVNGGDAICKGKKRKKLQMDTDCGFKPILNGKMISEAKILKFHDFQNNIISCSEDDKLTGEQITPLCDVISKRISEIPEGMLDSIRQLRLSRIDILKLMNSSTPVSHLSGFFLRIRLRKYEEGQEGTGYYVACITEAQGEKSLKISKNHLWVHVGSIDCLVQSRYISNHDFLEEELMAWWSAVSNGGKIPSEEDLKAKREERIKLGF